MMPSLPRSRGVLEILLGTVFISFSAVFVKLAHVGPTASGVYRNLFGALALLALTAVRRDTLWRGVTPVFYAVLAGVFFATDIFCWHRSILYIGPGLATIMGNFQVFVMALVGIAVFHERATWRFALSLPLAVLGLLLLVGFRWGALDASYRTGLLLGLATALTYAGYLLTLRRSQRAATRLAAVPNLALVTAVTAVILWIVAVKNGESLRIPDGQSWLVLVAYGVLCQALGWIVISRGLRTVDASRAGLLLLLQPTLTFVWDVLFFDRPTTPVEALGAVLAVGAIYMGSARR
jgi:drug/metabolite transporter (DMT)-like permease